MDSSKSRSKEAENVHKKTEQSYIHPESFQNTSEVQTEERSVRGKGPVL